MNKVINRIIEQMLERFEGIEFLYEFDSDTKDHLFKVLNPNLYYSESFQSFRNDALIGFVGNNFESLLFVDPDDDFIIFANPQKFSASFEPLSEEQKSYDALFSGGSLFLDYTDSPIVIDKVNNSKVSTEVELDNSYALAA